METTVNGFHVSGLWPLNMVVFSEADIHAAPVTDVTRLQREVVSPAMATNQLEQCNNTPSAFVDIALAVSVV